MGTRFRTDIAACGPNRVVAIQYRYGKGVPGSVHWPRVSRYEPTLTVLRNLRILASEASWSV
jgi:hypothetical protein